MTTRLRIQPLALALTLAALLAPALPRAAAQDLADFERARLLRVLDLLGRPAASPQAGSLAAARAAKPAGLNGSADDEAGALTGTVLDLVPEAYESAVVMAWRADSTYAADSTHAEDGQPVLPSDVAEAIAVARVTVHPDGAYRLDGLAPGTYYVSAMAKGYETAYYEDADKLADASPIEVSAGVTVEGIDFALVQYGAGEGGMAGQVTDSADGQPIAGAVVHAFVPDSPYKYGMAETGKDGTYRIAGLSSGEYIVEVWADGYLPRFHGGDSAYEGAVTVSVVEPDWATAIDFALSQGGSISGVVRNSAGEPVEGAYLSALAAIPYDSLFWNDDEIDGRLVPMRGGWTVTDSDGAYRLSGLTTGQYRVEAQYSTRWQYVSSWYDGVDSYDQAESVAVALGENTPGIDLVLDLPVLASAVSGRVTDTAGNPVPKAFVSLMSAVAWWGSSDTVYTEEGEVWTDPTQPDASGSSLSGAASDGVTIDAMPAVGAPVIETAAIARVWAYAATDEDGYYRIDELPTGTYLLSASLESGWEYVQRWYTDAAEPGDATEIVVGEAEHLSGIDVVLPLRQATASISGTVRDSNGHPLAWAFIRVAPTETGFAGADGSLDADAEWSALGRLWAYAQTDADGAYQVDRLPAGAYTVFASYSADDRYGHSWYDGVDSPETATPVPLVDGEARSGVDLQLDVRPLYGVVAGTVTEAATGDAIGRAYVELSGVERDVASSAPLRYGAAAAITDESGRFRMEWIPEGTYALRVYADGAVSQVGEAGPNTPCPALQVVGGDTTHCDVGLIMTPAAGAVISGRVTLGPSDVRLPPEGDDANPDQADTVQTDGEAGADADGSSGDADLSDLTFAGNTPWAPPWLPGIAVVVALPATDPDSGPRYTAVTDTDGAYALRGLPPGEYAIMCWAPGFIGMYYDGAYAPDRAETIPVEGETTIGGIDFELPVVYWCGFLEDERALDGDLAPAAEAAGGIAVYGNVADEAGLPVEEATVYLLDAEEQPVAFAQTGLDGSFELAGVAPGEYRLYASRLGYDGAYNGNRAEFAAAEPLALNDGQVQVDLVLHPIAATAVTDEAEAALPLALLLHRNYPNPFNPTTHIAFTVPASGPAVVRIHNAAGQLVAIPFRGRAEAGQRYEVVFDARGLATGAYFCVLESSGQRRVRPMALVK